MARRKRAAARPALPDCETLLKGVREILDRSRPASQRGELMANAARIARFLRRVREKQDDLTRRWEAYSDEEARLTDAIDLLRGADAQSPKLPEAEARREALRREMTSNRRDRTRWLRSEYRRAEVALPRLRDKTEKAGQSQDFQPWLLAWARQHVERLRKKCTTEELNELIEGREPADTAGVLALRPPDDYGLFAALPDLRQTHRLPYATIRDLLALSGIMETTPANLRAFARRHLVE